MKWEEFFDQLIDTFKVPETLEEAIDYINKEPTMQSLVEEMAFRQVVVNVLVAANIISEKDFNASVVHFKNLFTKSFAEELLSKVHDFNEKFDQKDKEEVEDADDWPDDTDEKHWA